MDLNENKHWPSVSVWVAARNEEENLPTCLQHLALQDYKGTWEVWIADDHSEDQTLSIAHAWVSENPHFHLLSVPEWEGGTKGKALALGLLAGKSRGDLYLICDADMRMPAQWISAMVAAIQKYQVDLLNGTTTTDGNGFFSAIQGIDWLLPQGTFSWLSKLGISYTAMGNNMAISKKAYWATGGYMYLPFSLTEDFELFKQARNRGFRLIHHFDERVLGYSKAEKSWSHWLEQHVRWMVGFMELPFSQKWVLYIQLLFFPLVFLSAFLFPPMTQQGLWGLFGIKLLYDFWILCRVMQFRLLPYLLIYQLIWWPFYISCLWAYHFSSHIKWKGRRWEK